MWSVSRPDGCHRALHRVDVECFAPARVPPSTPQGGCGVFRARTGATEHSTGRPSLGLVGCDFGTAGADIAPNGGQPARAVFVRDRASSISSSVVWKLVTKRMVSSLMR